MSSNNAARKIAVARAVSRTEDLANARANLARFLRLVEADDEAFASDPMRT